MFSGFTGVVDVSTPLPKLAPHYTRHIVNGFDNDRRDTVVLQVADQLAVNHDHVRVQSAKELEALRFVPDNAGHVTVLHPLAGYRQSPRHLCTNDTLITQRLQPSGELPNGRFAACSRTIPPVQSVGLANSGFRPLCPDASTPLGLGLRYVQHERRRFDAMLETVEFSNFVLAQVLLGATSVEYDQTIAT